MNKIISKKIFIKNKILTPNILHLIKMILKINDLKKFLKKKKKLNFLVVIKPISEGSSLGVKISKILKT